MDRPRPAEVYAETKLILDQTLAAETNEDIPPWLTREQVIEELRQQLASLEPLKDSRFWPDEREPEELVYV
jgi:hypothetical protein